MVYAIYILLHNMLTFKNAQLLYVDFKKMQCESCELSFIWGKMRPAAQETALQL